MLNKAAHFIIRFYQRWISICLRPRCRFYPTCSSYSLTCFERFGFIQALYLSLKRLLKCHELHPGGLDEVPHG